MRLVSIVLPVFNRGEWVTRTIENLLLQTYRQFEVIAVDDASTDQSLHVLRTLAANDSRIRCLRSKTHGGAQAARNLGIREAKGEWIAFQDSDDLWMPEKLERQMRELEQIGFDPMTVVHANCIVHDQEKKTRRLWKLPKTEGWQAFRLLLRTPSVLFPAILTSKAALAKIGFLDERVSAYQEWDTAIRLARHCRLIHVQEPLFTYTIHPGSAISKNGERAAEGYRYIMEKFRGQMLDHWGAVAWNGHQKHLLQILLNSGQWHRGYALLEESQLSDREIWELLRSTIFSLLQRRSWKSAAKLIDLWRQRRRPTLEKKIEFRILCFLVKAHINPRFLLVPALKLKSFFGSGRNADKALLSQVHGRMIAVVIDSYNIDYSPSLIHLLDFLGDSGRVDLFLHNVQMKNSRVLQKRNLRLVQIQPPFHWRRAVAALRHRAVAACRGQWRNALLPEYSVAKVARRFSGFAYHCHIALDLAGLTLCKKLFPEARPFCYSLELPEPGAFTVLPETNGENRSGDGVQKLVGAIRGLIIQSEERERLFRTGQQLPERIPALHLPVTGRGPAVDRRLDLLRQRYNVPPQARLALHLGGANPYYSSLEIASVFAGLPGWFLVFQGNHLRGYGEQIRAMAKLRGVNNIIVLKKFFTEIGALEQILMSCDVGVAWYNDISENFRSAGLSSGKITAYLKFGLPVVANRYPSTEKALLETGCGLCVDRPGELPDALTKLSADYERFSANARKEYEKRYRFEKYQLELGEFLGLTGPGGM